MRPDPTTLSPHYSFRTSGTALRIYRGDSVEQVVFDDGGSFSWSDEGVGYSLTFKGIEEGAPLGTLPDGTPGPAERNGIYDFMVNDGSETPPVSTITIGS